LFDFDIDIVYNEKMVELKTAEHVIHYMKSGSISLSRYDDKFISNLQSIKQVTTNQIELLYKIIYKYRRQFAKNELDVEKLIHLPWTMPIIESSTQYTNAFVSIEDRKIIFRCPYNNAFIKSFRGEPLNNFIWSKEKRHYEADFSQHAIKLLLTVASKHFKTINYCTTTTNLLDQLELYKDIKYWQPTLVNCNGNLIIMACNESLHNSLSDIKIDNDLNTLALLASRGVLIDESLYDINNERSKFFAQQSYTAEIQNIKDIALWIKEVGADHVVLLGAPLIEPNRKKIIADLERYNIGYTDLNIQVLDDTNKHKFPILLKFKTSVKAWPPKNLCKVINFVNSQPIDIK
jgi:hypothetical protein